MDRKKSLIIGAVLLVIGTAIITFLFSVYVVLNSDERPFNIYFDPEKVSMKNIQKFNEARNILVNDFYEDVDQNILIEGAISGMADSLKDPYTTYFTPEQMRKLMEMSEKSEENYSGIGVSITLDNDGVITIIEPFEGSPAIKAGVRQGDKIISVNGQDITGLKDEDMVIKMIKGPEGSNVRITVYRPSEGRWIDFDIIRKTIKYEYNIRSTVLDGDIGYIRIISFLDNKLFKIFNEHLDELLSKNIKSLIIDLRDNPGGSLQQVVYIADRLLPRGLIVYTEDRNKNVEQRNSDEVELDLPMAVLINGNSASASEILAGALKDHEKAILIGTKTFGKGIVQELRSLNDGSGLKVTTSKYFTPSGVCIQGIGIKPDIEVEMAEEFKNTPVSQIPKDKDPQLIKAEEAVGGH